MARKRKRIKNVYSVDERLIILKYWKDHNLDTNKTLQRYDISRGTLYNWKVKHWEELERMEEAGVETIKQAADIVHISTIDKSIDVQYEKKLQIKAINASEQIMDLIIFKVERDRRKMMDDEKHMGSIKVAELSKLLDISLSYVLPKASTKGDDDESNKFGRVYNRFTQIINNQLGNIDNTTNNGTKTNSAGGAKSWATFTPGDKQHETADKPSKKA